MFAPLRQVAGPLLDEADWPSLPTCAALLAAPPAVVNRRGQIIRPVLQQQSYSGSNGYEAHIAATGELPTRAADWHDLFNLLVWRLFPKTKSALNALHEQALADERGGRSRLRDALTLFDESGVVLLATPELAACVREFRWKELFWQRREQLAEQFHVTVFGHALYEKALQPYVGMTGHAVILPMPAAGWTTLALDEVLAGFLAAQPPASPRQLHPFPLLGLPGWWPETKQMAFYDNQAYFRPGRRQPTG